MAIVPTANRAKKLAIHMGKGAVAQVDTMLVRQNLAGSRANRRDVSGGAIGCLGGATLTKQGNLCFFTGTPINGPDVGELTDAHNAARLFPLWDGAFTGVFWDADQQTLVVATDCLGMQPLYMRHEDNGLTLVSETKAINGEPDLAAWGAFLAIGHPVGKRSLMDGLSRVPPASVLTYDCNSHELDIRRYWDWPEPSAAWHSYDFLGALEQDIHGYAAYGDRGTLLLSGGFDSRLLLFLLDRADVPVDALIVSHGDECADADGRLARAVAQRMRMPFRTARPCSDFYSSSAYIDYLKASDVGFPSLGLFIARVAEHIDSEAVWDGLAPGFVFMPLHQPQGGFQAYLEQEIKGTNSSIWRAAKELFKPDIVAAMHDGFSKDLQRETSHLAQNFHGMARFVIENRSRNRAAMNPLKVYANKSNAFTPGLSKDFLFHAATIPFTQKQHGCFYRSLFAQLDKRALKVPFLSGGELLRGDRADPAYYRERMRMFQAHYHSRYPSLFPWMKRWRVQHSKFLDERLLDGDDPLLHPDIRYKLQSGAVDQYAVWKLLFHWKTWQWLHDDRFDTMLGRG